METQLKTCDEETFVKLMEETKHYEFYIQDYENLHYIKKHDDFFIWAIILKKMYFQLFKGFLYSQKIFQTMYETNIFKYGIINKEKIIVKVKEHIREHEEEMDLCRKKLQEKFPHLSATQE